MLFLQLRGGVILWAGPRRYGWCLVVVLELPFRLNVVVWAGPRRFELCFAVFVGEGLVTGLWAGPRRVRDVVPVAVWIGRTAQVLVHRCCCGSACCANRGYPGERCCKRQLERPSGQNAPAG